MRNKKFKVIFVCAENITRSLTAEYCLKKYLQNKGIDDIEISSAGTDGTKNDISDHCFAHFEELEKMGIDISKHKRKPLTEEMAERADLIIAMSGTYQKWIKEKYHISAPLFTEITEGQKRTIDVPFSDDPACDPWLRKFVHDTYIAMPRIVDYIDKMREK